MRKFILPLIQRREIGLIILIVLLTGVTAYINPSFLAVSNLMQILNNCAPVALISCGVMLVIVTAEIDISVGSLTGLLSAFIALLMSREQLGWNPFLVMLIILFLGALMGTVTGLLVTIGKVPSIIVTLGLLTALRGAAIKVLGGKTIKDYPESFRYLGTESLLGVPISVWIAIAAIAFTAWLIRWTRLGRRLYALGSNPQSAILLGLNERALKCFTFAFTGFLTAVATILIVAKLGNVEAAIGKGDELLIVTCVVVGGVSISGGRGQLAGVMLAVFLMVMIRTNLTYLQLGPEATKWERAIQGLFILAAVILDHVASHAKPAESEA
ncbi:ABC transporter permease [Candidatus Sumerlaeota bacterium]|nr:ABC transporter permease [Candidatus Sumerlaeota bacterium]